MNAPIAATVSLEVPRFEIATPGNFAEITEVMARANQHALESPDGQLQWPNVANVHRRITDHIEREEFHIVLDGTGRIVGGVAITHRNGLWSDGEHVRAMHFHKIMKDPTAQTSRGVGAHLLGLVAEQTQAAGLDMVRCDAQSSMPHLIGRYTDHYGFTEMGRAWYTHLDKEATLLEVSAERLAIRCAALTVNHDAEVIVA